MDNYEGPSLDNSWVQQLIEQARQIPAAATAAVLGKGELYSPVKKINPTNEAVLDTYELLAKGETAIKMAKGRAKMASCFSKCVDSKNALCKSDCIAAFLKTTLIEIFLKYGANIPMLASEENIKVYLYY